MVLTLYGGFCLILLAVLAIIITPVLRADDLTTKQRYQIAGTFFVFFFAGAFGIYFYVGAPEVITLTMQREMKMAQLRRTIIEHSQVVKQTPEAVTSWAILGDSFMQTGQYQGAINAYKQAVTLTQGQPNAIVALVRAQIAYAEGKVTDEAKRGLEMVLLQDKENPDARYWMAVRKLQDGKMEEAMKEMRTLYYSLPEDSPLKAHIDEQIGNKPVTVRE